ncbi:MAG: hypothetical protein WA789_15935 [Candidatus Acidiferrum sp.]
MQTYNKQSRSGLRHKAHGINDKCSDAIAGFDERAHDRSEVAARMRCQGSDYVFNDDQPGRSALGSHASDEVPEWPKRAAASPI